MKHEEIILERIDRELQSFLRKKGIVSWYMMSNKLKKMKKEKIIAQFGGSIVLGNDIRNFDIYFKVKDTDDKWEMRNVRLE